MKARGKRVVYTRFWRLCQGRWSTRDVTLKNQGYLVLIKLKAIFNGKFCANNFLFFAGTYFFAIIFDLKKKRSKELR